MKTLKLLPLFLLFTLTLSACAATVSGLQQLPEEGVSLILFLVTAAFTWLLLYFFKLTGWDLRGYAGAVATTLSPFIVTAIESYLQLIPPVFDNLVLSVIHLLVLLVGSLGTFWLVQRRKAPSLS